MKTSIREIISATIALGASFYIYGIKYWLLIIPFWLGLYLMLRTKSLDWWGYNTT